MKGGKNIAGIKPAVVYIAVLAGVCLILGLALGMILERKHALRYLSPGAAGRYYSTHMGREFLPGGRIRRAWQRIRGVKRESCLEKLKKELGLSPQQYVKVKAITDKAGKQSEEAAGKLRTQEKQLREKFQAAFEQIRKDSDAGILKILNPEQKEKFEKLQAERKKECKKTDRTKKGRGRRRSRKD